MKDQVWTEIQKSINEPNSPKTNEIKYILPSGKKVTVNWEIAENALTSDYDISVVVVDLVEDISGDNKSFIDVEIHIPSQENCNVEKSDINIFNWNEKLDDEYNSLSETIKNMWNNNEI